MQDHTASHRPVKIVIGITLVSSMAVFGRGFLRFLKQHGFDVYLCARKDMLFDKIEDEGFTFIEMPFQRRFNILNDLHLICKFVLCFLRIRPQVTDFMTLKPRAVGILASRLTGVPVSISHIWGYFGDCNYDWFRKKVLFAANKVSNCSATRVVAICHQIKEAEEKAGRTRPEKTVVYGEGSAFGIDTDEFNLSQERMMKGRELRDRWRMNDNLVFGSVMRVNIEKGITELVDAFVDIYERHPDYRLVIAGRHDIRNRPSQRILTLMEEHPGIKFVGFVDDIRDFYAAIDIFVLPTYREGFCNSNLEASSMSKPIISTDIIGVNGSSVLDGVTGIIVPPRNTTELAEKMEHLACNPGLCAELARQGRKRVEKYFSNEHVWHLQLADICQLLQSKNIKPPIECSQLVTGTCSVCGHGKG